MLIVGSQEIYINLLLLNYAQVINPINRCSIAL